MLKKLRDRLSERDKTLFKLVLWSMLVVWMVFFFTYSMVIAKIFATIAPGIYGVGLWGQIMTWVGPVWVIFTSLLIIIGMAKYATKRLLPKKKEKD